MFKHYGNYNGKEKNITFLGFIMLLKIQSTKYYKKKKRKKKKEVNFKHSLDIFVDLFIK